jgi:hypothetical protein
MNLKRDWLFETFQTCWMMKLFLSIRSYLWLSLTPIYNIRVWHEISWVKQKLKRTWKNFK